MLETTLLSVMLKTGLELRLLKNFGGFFRNILNSPSAEVAVLARIAARDVRSSLGKNLRRIKDLTHLDPWTASKAQLQFGLEQGLRILVPARDSFFMIQYIYI